MYGSDELSAKVRSELEQVNFAAAGNRSGRRERGREGGELDSRLVCSADRLDAATKRTIGAHTTMHMVRRGRGCVNKQTCARSNADLSQRGGTRAGPSDGGGNAGAGCWYERRREGGREGERERRGGAGRLGATAQ